MLTPPGGQVLLAAQLPHDVRPKRARCTSREMATSFHCDQELRCIHHCRDKLSSTVEPLYNDINRLNILGDRRSTNSKLLSDLKLTHKNVLVLLSSNPSYRDRAFLFKISLEDVSLYRGSTVSERGSIARRMQWACVEVGTEGLEARCAA